jgi:hypothetical protein
LVAVFKGAVATLKKSEENLTPECRCLAEMSGVVPDLDAMLLDDVRSKCRC